MMVNKTIITSEKSCKLPTSLCNASTHYGSTGDVLTKWSGNHRNAGDGFLRFIQRRAALTLILLFSLEKSKGNLQSLTLLPCQAVNMSNGVILVRK